MQLRKVGVLGARVINSPLTSKILHGAKIASEVGSIVGVPGTGALAKGLGVAVS